MKSRKESMDCVAASAPCNDVRAHFAITAHTSHDITHTFCQKKARHR